MVGHSWRERDTTTNKKGAAFVAPPNSDSMLHHKTTTTLLPPSSAAALRPPPPPVHHHHHHQEARMDDVEAAALKRGRRVEAQPLPPPPPAVVADAQLDQDYAFLVTDGILGGEDFFVDDLLVFDGPDEDKDTMDDDDDPKADAFVIETITTTTTTTTNTSSAAVAAVKFEPPPLTLPTHDAAEFEWMSSIIDDTVTDPPPSPGVPPLRLATTTKTYPRIHHLPPPPAPPVPEAAHALSAAEGSVPIKAKRTKRPRAAPSGSSWALSDTSSGSVSSPSSSSCSSPSYTSYQYAVVLYDGSPPPPKKQQRPKKRGRKAKPPAPSAASDRRCTHCGSQKTPQWRTGPLGPKTLCNACGVRYKSGRLVPEYRPAASPTFVSHVHSNSHRKVLEMRRKKEQQHPLAVAPAVASF